jgi:hypothetical protein
MLNKHSTVARGLPNSLVVRLPHWGKRRLLHITVMSLLLMAVFLYIRLILQNKESGDFYETLWNNEG